MIFQDAVGSLCPIRTIGDQIFEAMKAHNEKKAAILYDFLDQSRMFRGTVEKGSRSLMNVPFVTDSDELNAKLIAIIAKYAQIT